MYESEELAGKVLVAWLFSPKQKSKDEPTITLRLSREVISSLR